MGPFFFRDSKQGPRFTAIEEDGGDKRLIQLNLLAKLMVLFYKILFNLTIATIAEAILFRISAEQMLSLYRVAPRYLKLDTSCCWS